MSESDSLSLFSSSSDEDRFRKEKTRSKFRTYDDDSDAKKTDDTVLGYTSSGVKYKIPVGKSESHSIIPSKKSRLSPPSKSENRYHDDDDDKWKRSVPSSKTSLSRPSYLVKDDKIKSSSKSTNSGEGYKSSHNPRSRSPIKHKPVIKDLFHEVIPMPKSYHNKSDIKPKPTFNGGRPDPELVKRKVILLIIITNNLKKNWKRNILKNLCY